MEHIRRNRKEQIILHASLKCFQQSHWFPTVNW